MLQENFKNRTPKVAFHSIMRIVLIHGTALILNTLNLSLGVSQIEGPENAITPRNFGLNITCMSIIMIFVVISP